VADYSARKPGGQLNAADAAHDDIHDGGVRPRVPGDRLGLLAGVGGPGVVAVQPEKDRQRVGAPLRGVAVTGYLST
jgi:hypothetical protein